MFATAFLCSDGDPRKTLPRLVATTPTRPRLPLSRCHPGTCQGQPLPHARTRATSAGHDHPKANRGGSRASVRGARRGAPAAPPARALARARGGRAPRDQVPALVPQQQGGARGAALAQGGGEGARARGDGDPEGAAVERRVDGGRVHWQDDDRPRRRRAAPRPRHLPHRARPRLRWQVAPRRGAGRGGGDVRDGAAPRDGSVFEGEWYDKPRRGAYAPCARASGATAGSTAARRVGVDADGLVPPSTTASGAKGCAGRVARDPDGTYDGEWRDDAPHGAGEHSALSERYVGEWIGGARHGKGTFFSALDRHRRAARRGGAGGRRGGSERSKRATESARRMARREGMASRCLAATAHGKHASAGRVEGCGGLTTSDISEATSHITSVHHLCRSAAHPHSLGRAPIWGRHLPRGAARLSLSPRPARA